MPLIMTVWLIIFFFPLKQEFYIELPFILLTRKNKKIIIEIDTFIEKLRKYILTKVTKNVHGFNPKYNLKGITWLWVLVTFYKDKIIWIRINLEPLI